MKKCIRPIIMAFICLSVITISGCGQKDNSNSVNIASSGQWVDGTYTESVKGKNGKLDVTVIIKDGIIADIQIGNNKETPDIGGKAISKLPSDIIKEQRYDVDAVSGATVTSNAIKNAVAKCLAQASN